MLPSMAERWAGCICRTQAQVRACEQSVGVWATMVFMPGYLPLFMIVSPVLAVWVDCSRVDSPFVWAASVLMAERILICFTQSETAWHFG